MVHIYKALRINIMVVPDVETAAIVIFQMHLFDRYDLNFMKWA